MNALGQTAKKALRNVGGSCLIVLGVAGLFLPFLQGILLILAGITMLDFERKEEMIRRLRESAPARRAIGWWSRRGGRGA